MILKSESWSHEEHRCVGLKQGEAEQTVRSLLSIPVITVNSAEFVVDGEEEGTEVLEEDVVTCSIRIVLRRAAHLEAGQILPTQS